MLVGLLVGVLVWEPRPLPRPGMDPVLIMLCVHTRDRLPGGHYTHEAYSANIPSMLFPSAGDKPTTHWASAEYGDPYVRL